MRREDVLEEIRKCACLFVIVVCALLILFTLTACGKTVIQDRPVRVAVPVAQSCALPRPTPPAPLSARSDWDSLDVKQKAALVAKQALLWQTYGEQLNAATAACP
jgi:hypothetical protein